MTLDRSKVNSNYIIQKLDLPLHVEKRLMALGMTAGTKISVLNSKNHGTLIIKVRGTRLALGKEITQKIIVRRYLWNKI